MWKNDTDAYTLPCHGYVMKTTGVLGALYFCYSSLAFRNWFITEAIEEEERKSWTFCVLCIWQDINHSNFKHETGHWQWQTWLATSQFSSSNSSSELSIIVTRCQVPLSPAVGLQAPKEIITRNSPIQCGFCICRDELTPKQIPSAFLLTVNISVESSWVSQKAENKENKFLRSVAETWSLLFKRA